MVKQGKGCERVETPGGIDLQRNSKERKTKSEMQFQGDCREEESDKKCWQVSIIFKRALLSGNSDVIHTFRVLSRETYELVA